jgi:uncharacterized protein YbjQ (UPF0145 family)
MTTTTFTLENHRVIHTLGVVRGIVRALALRVSGRSAPACRRSSGGNISLYTELCEKAREEAYEIMMAHAERRGANAGWACAMTPPRSPRASRRVLCYGTAVVVEPLETEYER